MKQTAMMVTYVSELFVTTRVHENFRFGEIAELKEARQNCIFASNGVLQKKGS